MAALVAPMSEDEGQVAASVRATSAVRLAASASGVALHLVRAPASVIRVITLLDGLLAREVRARVTTDAGTSTPDPALVALAPS